MSEADGIINIQVETSAFVDVLSEFVHVTQTAVEHGLRVIARELLRDSRLYVPVLTGRLRDSGRVEEQPTITDAERAVHVIYGDPQITYAWLQHQEPFNHPSLGFYGPAKYLEKPLIRNIQFYLALFAAEVRIAIERRY